MNSVYKVKLPKVLYLILLTSKYAKKKGYYNTNDLVKNANKVAKHLVRLRKNKKDYKFLDDTNFGGLRGNLSTILTLRGYVKRGSRYTAYYGIGKDDRLFNAVERGEIILDIQDFSAYTNNLALSKLLETEASLLNIRESQAHIKVFLEKNPTLGLIRVEDIFPKESVVKTVNDVFFLRIILNNYLSLSKDVIEYNMLNYWSGTKFKKHNIHAMFVVPGDEPWEKIYAIDSKDLINDCPLFVYFDINSEVFYGANGKVYPHSSINYAMANFSPQNANISTRLAYDWRKVRDDMCDSYTSGTANVKSDEFSEFLADFLKWKKTFSINGKDIVDMQVSSSGGPDVRLQYSGGTTQNLELEHTWSSYLTHGHHKSMAWKGSWLYASELWDFEKIKKIFEPYLTTDIDRIPTVFLSVDKSSNEKKAYKVNWQNKTFSEIEITE